MFRQQCPSPQALRARHGEDWGERGQRHWLDPESAVLGLVLTLVPRGCCPAGSRVRRGPRADETDARGGWHSWGHCWDAEQGSNTNREAARQYGGPLGVGFQVRPLTLHPSSRASYPIAGSSLGAASQPGEHPTAPGPASYSGSLIPSSLAGPGSGENWSLGAEGHRGGWLGAVNYGPRCGHTKEPGRQVGLGGALHFLLALGPCHPAPEKRPVLKEGAGRIRPPATCLWGVGALPQGSKWGPAERNCPFWEPQGC